MTDIRMRRKRQHEVGDDAIGTTTGYYYYHNDRQGALRPSIVNYAYLFIALLGDSPPHIRLPSFMTDIRMRKSSRIRKWGDNSGLPSSKAPKGDWGK